MKLQIQIPAYNEEQSIGAAVADVHGSLPALRSFIADVELVVINDGSADRTAEIARSLGVEVIDIPHRGLGVAFVEGVRFGLNRGADIIVNMDADLQYRAQDIRNLVEPILNGTSDACVGDRQIGAVVDYSPIKRLAQRMGNVLVSALFRTRVCDATSGFWALNRGSAGLLAAEMRNHYTYTIDSLCLLLTAGKRLSYVPIEIRPPRRPSRLITSKIAYVRNFLAVSLRHFVARRRYAAPTGH